jgi:hypothetical protein
MLHPMAMGCIGPAMRCIEAEPLLDSVMRGDPRACSILGGLLLVGMFVVVYKLLK